MRSRLLTSVLLASAAAAQDWSRVYDGSIPMERGSGVIETHSGDLLFFVAGDAVTHLTWVDSSGQTLRSREIEGSVREAKTHGPNRTVLVGTDVTFTGLGWVAAIDDQANFLWQSRHPSWFDLALLRGLDHTADGGHVVVGGYSYVDYYSSQAHGVVHRLDSSGGLLWSRQLNETDYFQHGAMWDVLVLGDGTIVTCGEFDQRAVFTAFDDAGNQLWSRERSVDRVWDMTKLTGGGFAAAARNYVGAFDAGGSPIWEREFGTSFDQGILDIIGTSDGGVLLGGYEVVNSGYEAILVKLDALGNVQWQRSLGEGAISVSDMIERTGGGYAITCDAVGNGPPRLISIDASGISSSCATAQAHVPMLGTTTTETPYPTFLHLNWSLVTTTHGSSTLLDVLAEYCPSELGTKECTAVPHSGGVAGKLNVSGSDEASHDELVLQAYDLPLNQFGLLLAGQGSGQVTPPLSSGTLCLSGAPITRYLPPLHSGSAGAFGASIGTAVPGQGQILAGETWHFQAWFRDLGSTSNFTESRSVTFQ